jgi:hypothetical protein
MDSHPMVARPGVLCGLDRRPGPLPECWPIATHHAGAREGVFQRGAYVQLDRRAGFASPQNCAGAINPCTGIPVKNPSWQFVGEMTLKGTADHHACIPNSILGSMLAEAICDVTIRLHYYKSLYQQSAIYYSNCTLLLSRRYSGHTVATDRIGLLLLCSTADLATTHFLK